MKWEVTLKSGEKIIITAENFSEFEKELRKRFTRKYWRFIKGISMLGGEKDEGAGKFDR